MAENGTETFQDNISCQQQDLVRLEAEIIEQEHRLLKVGLRFLDRDKWGRNDPRRLAAKRAILYSLFSSRSIAVGGGVAVLVSLYGVFSQAEKMSEQNTLIAEQLDASHRQWLSEYRQFLFSTLYEKEDCALEKKPYPHVVRRTNGVVNIEIVDEDPCLVASARARGEAAVNLYALEQERKKSGCSRSDGCRPDFSGVDLSFAKLSGEDFSGSIFTESALYRTNLTNADIRGSYFHEAKMSAVRLIGVKARNCTFRLSPMVGAFLYGGDFEGCDFLDLDLSRSCLMSASFRNVDFKSVDLQGVKFHFSNLTGAKFRYAKNLHPEQLNNACSNGGTELPFAYSLPPCRGPSITPGEVDEQRAIDQCFSYK
jgi:hypothetical protein